LVEGSRLARAGSPRVPERECRCRWVICSLLFLATTVNYIDRQILVLVKAFLDRELGWSNEQFGLVNSAFLFGICAFMYLLSFGIHHILAPRLEPLTLPE
jgi:ACS family hexuronate transporter-like MFS transporter